MNYTVVDYYDLRPLDWMSGKRMPLEPGEGHICDRCGAEHAVVYVVKDLTTNKTYSVGSGCAKASFGFDPSSDKHAKKIVTSKKREAETLLNDRKLKEVGDLAQAIANEVKRLPVPTIEHVNDTPSKYAHYSGQLVRTFRMGKIEADEWQQRDSCWHDNQTIALLKLRWISNEVESRLPTELKSVTLATNPRRPRFTSSMYEACLSAALKLLR